MSVWRCPGLRTGVDVAIGHKAITGIPLPWLRTRPCTIFVDCRIATAGQRLPRCGPRQCRVLLSSNALLSCRATGVGDLAADGPDEGGELACHRGDGDGLELAVAGERPIARIEPVLRLPGDLADCARRRRHLGLLVLADPGRMPIGPGALDQQPARPPVAGLGDRPARDPLTGGSLR